MGRARRCCAHVIFAAIALTPFAANAQRPETEPVRERSRWYVTPSPDRPQSERDRLRRLAARDAARRLPRLLGEIERIDDVTSRVRLRAHFAAAFWDRDATTSRALITKAFDETKHCTATAPSAGEINPGRSVLRREVLRIASDHDAALAARLLAGVSESGTGTDARIRASYESPRSIALVENALDLVRTSPANAERAARESLQGGITSNLPDVIKSLGAADAELGGRLRDAAIDRIATNHVFPLEIYTLGAFLVGDALDPKRFGEPDGSHTCDPETARRFLQAAISATDRFVTQLEQASDDTDKLPAPFDSASFEGDEVPSVEEISGSFFSAMTDLLPAYDFYDRAGSASARALVDRLGRFMDPVERKHMYVFYDNGDTPASLVAEADASADAKSRNELLELAIELALGEHDFETARPLVERLDDLAKREWYMRSFVVDPILEAERAGRYEDVRSLLARVPSANTRASIAGHVIIMALQRGGRTDVAALEHDTIAALGPDGGVSPALAAELLLRIARFHTSLKDLETGFTLVTAAVDAANRAAPIDVDAYRSIGRQRPFDSMTCIGGNLDAFEYLASADYPRALRLARMFAEPALRLEAHLAVVRAALRREP